MKVHWLNTVGWMLLAAVLFPSVAHAVGPRDTVEQFYTAILAGQADKARQLAVGREQQLKMLDTLAKTSAAMSQLQGIAVERWGAAGQALGSGDPTATARAELDDAEEKIDGDSATVGPKDAQNPVKLRRINGAWKVDMAAHPAADKFAQAEDVFVAMIVAAGEIGQEIKDGKFTMPEQAQQEFAQRVLRKLTPTTQPADPA